MISHGKEIKLFAGNSNPALAQGISDSLGIALGNSVCTNFADGECSVSVYEPVRGTDVFIVQSTCKPVNDNLMELLIMCDAMKRASPGRITAVTGTEQITRNFPWRRTDVHVRFVDVIGTDTAAKLRADFPAE